MISRNTLRAFTGLGALGFGALVPAGFVTHWLAPRAPITAPVAAVPHFSILSQGSVAELHTSTHAPKVASSSADATGSIPKRTGVSIEPPAPEHALLAIEAARHMPVDLGGINSAAAAYAPSDNPLSTVLPRVESRKPVLTIDTAGIAETIAAYRAGDLAKGDELARAVKDPLARLTLEWVALRTQPRLAGFERISAFVSAHPDWTGLSHLRKRAEEALWIDKKPAATVKAWFKTRAPESFPGKLALARVARAEGRDAEAASLVRSVWQTEELTSWSEKAIPKEFGEYLTPADHKFRADRLVYREKTSAANRAAAFASKDVQALIRARAAVMDEAASDKLMEAVPPALRTDAGYLHAQIQRLRRANKIDEAASLMLSVPPELAKIVDGDAWWTERRLVARKLLDKGDARTAYRIVSEHAAQTSEGRIEAEFHAGWIALRYCDNPTAAKLHFAAAASISETPISRARAAYWQGRTAEVLAEKDDAQRFFAAAAEQSGAYYGQLARARLGMKDLPVRQPAKIAEGDARAEVVRVVEILDTLDFKDLAQPLAFDAAKSLPEDQVAALAQVLRLSGDARSTLVVGKLASYRGIAIDEAAFPTFGVPGFEPLANSAGQAMVYAIARQESAFQADVVSHAGAKGLMQMLTSTARRTAQRAGVAFDESKLTSDPSFNAKLGAAHLGELIAENRGSLIMTFAAYNAGGKRVKEWIAAYGDPRSGDVDPIDWVERIPFTETRNYVQRVTENLEMYRARFNEPGSAVVVKDLRAREARL